MTVDDLLEQLKKMVEKGHGKKLVFINDDEYDYPVGHIALEDDEDYLLILRK